MNGEEYKGQIDKLYDTMVEIRNNNKRISADDFSDKAPYILKIILYPEYRLNNIICIIKNCGHTHNRCRGTECKNLHFYLTYFIKMAKGRVLEPYRFIEFMIDNLIK